MENKRKLLYSTIAVIAGLLIMLLPGCGKEQNPSLSTQSATGTTQENLGSGIQDSIFDDPQFGDMKPVNKPSQSTDSTDSAKPAEPDNAASDSTTDGTTEGTTGGAVEDLPAPNTMSYEEFIALSPDLQRAYQESYGNDEAGLQAFFAWYNAAKEKYEKENPPIDIGDGKVDLGDYVN